MRQEAFAALPVPEFRLGKNSIKRTDYPFPNLLCCFSQALLHRFLNQAMYPQTATLLVAFYQREPEQRRDQLVECENTLLHENLGDRR
jgi:hypothetical protein